MRRFPLGHGQDAVVIGVGAVEPLQRTRAHLLKRDETLLAEHPTAMHATTAGAIRAIRTAGAHAPAAMAAGTVRAIAHRMRLGEFVAADIAVMMASRRSNAC